MLNKSSYAKFKHDLWINQNAVITQYWIKVFVLNLYIMYICIYISNFILQRKVNEFWWNTWQHYINSSLSLPFVTYFFLGPCFYYKSKATFTFLYIFFHVYYFMLKCISSKSMLRVYCCMFLMFGWRCTIKM